MANGDIANQNEENKEEIKEKRPMQIFYIPLCICIGTCLGVLGGQFLINKHFILGGLFGLALGTVIGCSMDITCDNRRARAEREAREKAERERKAQEEKEALEREEQEKAEKIRLKKEANKIKQ